MKSIKIQMVKIILFCVSLSAAFALLYGITAFAQDISLNNPLIDSNGVMTVNGMAASGKTEKISFWVVNVKDLDSTYFDYQNKTPQQIIAKTSELVQQNRIIHVQQLDTNADGSFSFTINLKNAGAPIGCPYKVLVRLNDMQSPKYVDTYYASTEDIRRSLDKIKQSNVNELVRIFSQDFIPDYYSGEIPYALILAVDINGYYSILNDKTTVLQTLAGKDFVDKNQALSAFDNAVKVQARKEIKFGKVNTSEAKPVNISDVIMALRLMGGNYKEHPQADVDMDRSITMFDVQKISQLISGDITGFDNTGGN